MIVVQMDKAAAVEQVLVQGPEFFANRQVVDRGELAGFRVEQRVDKKPEVVFEQAPEGFQ
ncbi:MAG: hypothetical protein RLZZ253_2937, partial [Verrucomicrobiota bacterium]